MKSTNMREPWDYLSEAIMRYEQGKAFAECAKKLEVEEWDAYKQINQNTVVIVNSAFACELFLKALIYFYEKNRGKRTHCLKGLFEQLPTETQERISTYCISHHGTITDCFGQSLIAQIDNSFSEWRYSFEKRKLSVNIGFLLTFRNAIQLECEKVLKINSDL